MGLFAVVACGAASGGLHAKPKGKPAPAADSSPAPLAADGSAVLARWLLQQDGGKDALVLPLGDVVHAVSGMNVRPVDPHDPADASLIQTLGGVMDGVLPLMNKPDSPARLAVQPGGVADAFEAALAARFQENADVTLVAAEGSAPVRRGGGYPAFRVIQKASQKAFYLGVTLYETRARNSLARAVRIVPGEAAGVVTTDGACVLVAVETNGKNGKEAAFLNWEILDLTKLSVRAAMTFEANQNAVHTPEALLNDGRKGRD